MGFSARCRSLGLVVVLMASLVALVPLGPTGGAGAFMYTASNNGLPSDGTYSFIGKADLNKDGHVDIVSGSDRYGDTPSPYGLHVWLGDGKGKWSESSSGLPTDNTFGGIGIGDLDGDGDLDIVAAFETWAGGDGLGVGVWKGDGTGKWTAGQKPTDSGGYDSAILVDMNKDSKLDIVAGSRGAGIKVWFGDGTGATWTTSCTGLPTGGEYTGVAAGDPDKDGDMDIAAGNYNGDGIQFWANDGSCGFTEQSDGLGTGDSSFSAVFADMDKDGNTDLVGTIRGQGVNVWKGDGGAGGGMTWTSSRQGLPDDGRYKQLDVGDVDGDGNLDLAAARPDGGLHVWKGNGGAGGLSFIDETGDLPTDGTCYGVGLADINEDGTLDVIGATWGDGVQAYVVTVGPKDTVAPSAIYDLAASGAETETVTLKWTASGDDGRNGTAAKYEIRYSKTGAVNTDAAFPSATDAGAGPTPKAPGGAESFIVTGLSGNTTYYFAVKVIDDGLNYAYSNSVSATTKPVVGDELPPVVNILSPGVGETVKDTVVVKVNFSDADGRVNNLEFYIDDVMWSSVSIDAGVSTYEWSWNTRDTTRNLANGDHVLRVVASDVAGHTSDAKYTVNVANAEEGNSRCKGSKCGGGIPGFEAVMLVAALVLAMAGVSRLRG